MNKKHPILFRIEEGEHQRLDFKYEISDCHKIAKTISAFANTEGGSLLIGVKDNGKIAGIQSEEEVYMIEAAASLYCTPAIPITTKSWIVENKTILEAIIPVTDDPPCFAIDEKKKKQAYIRVKDENFIANDILLCAWKKKKRKEGILLQFSYPVKKLLSYLETHSYITPRMFCKQTHISYTTAKKIISDLLATDILSYTMIERRIVYIRST